MLTEGANYPFTHIRAAFHKIWWLVNTTPHIGSCIISADRSCITVRGTPVLIADIPAWYKGLVTKAEGQLDKVLCGLIFPEFDKLVAQRLSASAPQDAFIDVHNNQEVGYSFITERKNKLGEYGEALLAAIFDNNELGSRFYIYDNDGNPHSRPGVFTPYLISEIT